MAFDAAAYLAANPDVAAQVNAGGFGGDAYQHYLQYGQAEGRDLGTAAPAAAQPNFQSGAGYASNITAPAGTGAYYAQLNDAMAAYRAGTGVNPATGKTAAEEAGTFWNPGNAGMKNYFEANPDVMMNYLVNAGASGVDPQQYAVAHSDMGQTGYDSGRGGVLPTGQTTFERLLGREGGSIYNTFGQGSASMLDPRQGIVTPATDAAKYQQVYGGMMSNTGPFAGLGYQDQRQALQGQLTQAFNSLSSGGSGSTGATRPTTNLPITSGMFGNTPGVSNVTANFNNPNVTGVNKAGAGGTSGDYNTQLQDYYKAYFGDKSAPNMSMLDSWYKGSYKPQGGIAPTASGAPASAQPIAGGTGNMTGGSSNNNIGATGGASTTAPGGQGVNQATVSAALGALSVSTNPVLKALYPLISSLVSTGSAMVLDGQIAGMSAADAKLAASQVLGSLGIQTVADADGNIRTISTPGSIAAADEATFGDSGGGGTTGSYGGFGGISGADGDPYSH